ncbi:N-acetylmuramoyl-L-alanine amidase family protein [Paenibacillus agricola]|uniref:N-acetylmuramoyl-L-alanine amidase n=1 Tax=Paenibacillus agricola TaxID=2716264 RepID=A0ABX0J2D6_9BACL|nr:N-acetylmuramoyl-L-alanine amidase [Paenibacillus agricola]NHN30128.1 N-acetylmuramoyl-L-alanine amidase [Paenibacillus agricola]
MRLRIMLLTLVLMLGMTSSSWISTSASAKPYPYMLNPFLTHVDVLIDVGHGGIDSGTLHGDLYEKDINLEMGKLIYSSLSEKGLRVLLNRMDDYALSGENLWYRHRSRHLKDLAQRSHLANEIHPKAVISLHVNWSTNSKARGPVILHQNTEPSKQLAAALQQSLNTLYATQGASHHGKTYFLLKHVHVPAVIVEMGFISNPQDREQMMQPQKQKQLAESITAGVMAYLQTKQTP